VTRVLEVGQYVAGRRIVSLRETKQRGWRATDEYGRSYYQRGPDGHPDGLLTVTDTGLTRSFWPETEAPARKRIAAVSDKQAKKIRDARPVRELVHDRDLGCVLRHRHDAWGPCWGPLEAHHLAKASAGGESTPANLLSTCRLHNQAVEREPESAKAFGLVVNHDITPVEAYRRREFHGVVPGTPPEVAS